MSRILFPQPSPLPLCGLCLFTRSPSFQKVTCNRRIPLLAWSPQIRVTHLLGAPRTAGTGTRGRGEERGNPQGHLWFPLTRTDRGTRQGRREGNSVFSLKLTWPIKSHQIWGSLLHPPMNCFVVVFSTLLLLSKVKQGQLPGPRGGDSRPTHHSCLVWAWWRQLLSPGFSN